MPIHLLKNERLVGPFEVDQIVAWLRAGQISPDDLGAVRAGAEPVPLRQLVPVPPATSRAPAPMVAPPRVPSTPPAGPGGSRRALAAMAVVATLTGAVLWLRDRSSADGGAETPTAEERGYLDSARPFVEAMAARRYADAHARLTSGALASLRWHQFAPEEDGDAPRAVGVTAADFQAAMEDVEERLGAPNGEEETHVHTTDPKSLSGRAEGSVEHIDGVFAIGGMPDSVSPGSRKASLRSRVSTLWSAAQLGAVPDLLTKNKARSIGYDA